MIYFRKGDYVKKVISLIIAVIAVIATLEITAEYNNVIATSNNYSDKTVQIGGQPFGIKFYSQGVMITKVRKDSASEECGLRTNDIIVMINGNEIEDNRKVKNIIEKSNGKSLKITVNRDYEIMDFTLKPKQVNGKYTAGMWIKDSCAGIGTITYYDTDNNTFACLGHGICDKESSTLLPMHEGDICPAVIEGVEKGRSGSPGGLSGYFKDSEIGSAYCNSKFGLFCNSEFKPQYKEYKIADIKEIEPGKAYIYSTTIGETPEMYQVEIKPTNKLLFDKDKDLIIEVTDKKLLEQTGGIVQGMSGSPIVQNDKIVGAVTHVFVNDPTKGYGIYIQTMLDESEQ